MRIWILFLLLSFSQIILAQQPTLVTPIPHTSFVTNAKFSSNGEFVVTASEDKSAKVWSVFTGQLLFTATHADKVADAAFSKDNKLLLTVSDDSTAIIWSLAERKLLHKLKGHNNRIITGEFSNDGTMVITGARENVCIIWDVATGKILKKVTVFENDGYIEGTGAVYAVSFSKDGSKFLTGDFSGKCAVWNLKTGDTIRSFTALGSFIKVAKFSDDEKYIIAAEWSGFDAYVWELSTGRIMHQFHSDDPFHEYAVLNNENTRFLTVLNDTTAVLYDFTTGKLLHSYNHSEKIFDATISKDNKHVITVSMDGKVKIWDAISGILLKEFKDHDGMVMKVSISPDNRHFATVSTDMSAKIYDLQNLRLFRDLDYGGYYKKEGSYFVGNNKVLINNDTAFTVFDVKNISIKPEEHFGWADWSFKNADAKYSIRLSKGANKTDYLKVYDQQMQLVLTIEDHLRYPIPLISNSGKYLFIMNQGWYGVMYSLPDGKLLDTILSQNLYSILDLCFSADDRFFVVSRGDRRIQVWDMHSRKLIYQLEEQIRATDLLITKDNKFLVAGVGNKLKYYDMSNGALLKEVMVGDTTFRNIALSTHEKYIVVASDDKKVHSYNFMRDEPIYIMDHNPFDKYGKSGTSVMRVTDRLVFSSISSSELIWDIHTGLLTDGKNCAKGSKLLYEPKRNLVAFCEPTTTIWDLNTKKIKTQLYVTNDGYETIRDAQFSADGTKLILLTYKRIALFDVDSGKLLHDFNELENQVLSARFSSDGKQLLLSTTGFDYIYDLKDLKIRYSILTQKKQDFLIRTAEGYYTCSRDIVKQLHYVTNGLQTLGFEQLDIKYNRPDLVLKAIGNTDTNLINSYFKAYQKRIKKLGIDTTQFSAGYSVPESDYTNRETIEYEQKKDKLELKIHGVDTTYKLDRFNIWVNEIPIYGQRGINIRHKKSNSIDTSITIQLSDGENRIETSIMNMNGTESYRMPLYVKYTPEKALTPKVYFIGLGMDTFADSRNNLNYSSKDIHDMADSLKSRYGDTIIIKTFFNQQVTAQKLVELKKMLLKTNVNDKVIVSYSGHGLLSENYDYYLSTYHVDFDHPEIKGLPYEALENLLDSIPARQKLMLIDACHSGEVDKDEYQSIKAFSDSLGIKRAHLGPIPDDKKNNHLGLSNSFELMQNLFVNVGKGTGATIISASAGTQFALEKRDLQNGVFTYCVLEAMNNNKTMTVSQLKTIVGKRVVELTHGMQKPTSRNETINSDWSVW